MKKMIAFLFVALMAASVFAGGRSQGGAPASAAAAESGKKYTSVPFVTDGRTTFTMFIPLGSNQMITSYDYKDNSYTREVVDATGVKLEFIAVSSAEQSQRRNLLLASGDYPDIINDRSLPYNDMCYWASEGIFVPLDAYNPLSYPNIALAFEEYPALNQKLRSSDGKLYSLPRVDDAVWEMYIRGRGWYYMPWVRDNNRKVPATLDEFTAYLRWIRDNDVNGNGDQNDEVPLVFRDIRLATAFFAKSFMPFVYDTSNFGLALYDGKVTEQYRLNEYRDALKYMAGLYREKLIKEDAFTLTSDQLKSLVKNPAPVAGVMLSSYSHDVVGTTDPRWPEMFVLYPMNGPGGRHWATNRDPWGILQPSWFITDKCKDPELAVALFDYMLNLEMLLNGKHNKGVSWTEPDPGALGLDGKPALYKRLLAETSMAANSLWYVQNPMLMNKRNRYGEQAQDIDTINKWLATGDKSLHEAAFKNPSFLLGALIPWSSGDTANAIPDRYFIPPTALDDADNKRMADINAVLNPFKEQAIAEFVTGVRDINSDAAWNAYLAELDRMGSRDLVAIYQKYMK
ncbi:MAG: extracellular solute-binding protein [Treponema sp.]|jgi:putative aldouronate transport system substrate-binding protein|nr:extracellular solute-binding protein [Treponema sp.]